jgi:hypothetical protein
MVSQKQTQDLLVSPKGALWLVAVALVIGMIAWAMANGPREPQTSYNTDQPGLYNAGQYNTPVPGGPSVNQGALESAPPAGPVTTSPNLK